MPGAGSPRDAGVVVVHRPGRDPRRPRRRPARPDVRACRAAVRLPGRGARPGRDQPGRHDRPRARPHRLPRRRPASRGWPRSAAALTTEFENVPAEALATLARSRPVAPGADAVAICQDRAAEKAAFARAGVACAPYAVLASAADLDARRRRAPARHPEDRAPRLRRQGPAPGRRAAPSWPAPSPSSAA